MKQAIKKLMAQAGQPPLKQLVDEALALRREIAAGPRFGDARDEKLSAEAYLDEALQNAKLTREEAEALDAAVSRLDEREGGYVLRFVGNVYAGAVATRPQDGVNLRPIVGNLHVKLGGGSNDFMMMLVQANLVGATPLKLVAVAALRAARDHPESFGSISDWGERERQQARLGELYGRIAASWRQATLEYGELGADSRALVSVRVGDAVVPAAPLDTLGERLCQALVEAA